MPIAKVTSEKMERKDYYRQQVNADNALIAYGYNALAGYLPQEVMARIRNRLADAVNKELEHELEVAIQNNRAFATYLGYYLTEYVDPSLHAEAMALYRKLGWPY